MKRDDYGRIAPWYDLLPGAFIRTLPPRGFQHFRAAAGMRVLEVGCGTGLQLGFYRAQGCRATGVDLSAGMLRVARARLDPATLVCRADAARLPYPNGVFHRVLATLVLHEMAPALRPTVLAEMIRVLHPVGRLGIIDYHPSAAPSLKGVLARALIRGIERAAGGGHYRHYRHFVASAGVPGLARRQGLHLEHCQRVSGGNIGIYRLRRQNPAPGV